MTLPHPLPNPYVLGIIFSFILFETCAIVWSVWSFVQSLRFSYHLYIKTGMLAFAGLSSEDENYFSKRDARDNMRQELELPDAWHAYTWLGCCLQLIVLCVCAAAGAMLWPVTVVVFFPMAGVLILGREKRRKQIFLDRLKTGR